MNTPGGPANVDELFFDHGLLSVKVRSASLYNRSGQPGSAYVLVSVQQKSTWGSKGRSPPVAHTGEPEWNWNWTTVIRNLGTKKDPSTFKVEVYAKRFLVDEFLGQVVLPVVSFADTNEYELKLPLMQKDTWEGDIQGEVDVSVHFSVDVNSLLTQSEIHKFYDHLKLLKPETPWAETTAQKWKVLEEMHRENAEVKKENEEKNQPLAFIAQLQDEDGGMTLERWKRLRRRLVDNSWQEAFIKLRGLEYIFYVVQQIIMRFK